MKRLIITTFTLSICATMFAQEAKKQAVTLTPREVAAQKAIKEYGVRVNNERYANEQDLLKKINIETWVGPEDRKKFIDMYRTSIRKRGGDGLTIAITNEQELKEIQKMATYPKFNAVAKAACIDMFNEYKEYGIGVTKEEHERRLAHIQNLKEMRIRDSLNVVAQNENLEKVKIQLLRVNDETSSESVRRADIDEYIKAINDAGLNSKNQRNRFNTLCDLVVDNTLNESARAIVKKMRNELYK